jgi:hypothetical protein
MPTVFLLLGTSETLGDALIGAENFFESQLRSATDRLNYFETS